MAAAAFAIAVPGDGSQRFQPIHVDDVVRVVSMALETDRLVRQTVDPVGPRAITLREILEDYRRWLGIAPARVVQVPMPLVRLACALGDRIGGPLNTTALRQLEHGNTGDVEAFTRATGIVPREWRAALAAEPSHVQDRWHARIYFVRPILRFALAFLWLVSGVTGILELRGWSVLVASQTAMGFGAALSLLALACVADVAIALLLLRRWKPRTLAATQVALVVAYSAIATFLWPSLWLEPLGPLFKNVPIAAAALALGAIEETG
jgi:hypothetical protein